MRVGFFGQTGPYAPDALRRLLRGDGPYDVVLVVEGRRRPPGRSPHKFYRPQVRPMPAGEDLTGIGTSAGVPVLVTSDVNATVAVGEIAGFSLDMLVCVGFDRLFKRPLLATASRGGINAHPSRLPELRGPSPIFWAIRGGATRLTVTLHGLDAGEDHGPIYAQEAFEAPPLATGDALYSLAGRLAGRMLHALLGRAATGSLQGRQQDHARATRAPRPTPDDARVDPQAFRCQELANFASAARFFRAIWIRIGHDVFFVRRGLSAEPGRTLPGEHLLEGDRLAVQCRDGVAHLELQ